MLGGSRLLIAFLILLIGVAAVVFGEDSGPVDSAPSSPAGPPKAKVAPVEDNIQGHKIVDPYRYLENPGDPDTKVYVEQELSYTRAILDPLPGRDKINARLSQLLEIGTVGAPQMGGRYYFHTRREGNQNQPILYVREGVNGAINGEDRVLVDVNKLSADGTVALDWWFVSEDGKYVAYGTSASGSEESTLHIIESATGTVLPDTIDRTRFASVAWMKDSSAFYYTRHPKKGEVPDGEEVYHVQVFYHQIGSDPAKDPLIFGDRPNPQDIPNVTLSEDDRWLLINVEHGWTRTEMYLQDLQTKNPPLEITTGKDFLYGAEFFEGKLYITTNEDAPRYRVFVADATNAKRDSWKELIPQTDAVLHSVYCVDLADVKSALWAKVDAPSIDPSAYDVQQVWYTSKDGTKVPMFVVNKKGIEKNGKNPTLLTGYGGFNISLKPPFNRSMYLWMEHGGIYAVANLRGGSEFGEDWHRAGMLEKKQNVFDDFIAAGEYLIAQKYTDKDHLAIQGGSNGGLLMGAMITQRPDLFRAVVCAVPLLDMLRYQNFQIAKLWIPEYGSAEDAKQFEWLYAYSPYHHVKAGQEYPAILFMTGDTDTRVDPMHAKKMAALMQSEAKNGATQHKPILLRIETKAGHGQGKPVTKQIEENTDMYSFLFWQLGIKP